MKFKRWGTLAPQRHVHENDFYEYHEAPVEHGIYAFPEYYASKDFPRSGCISNGAIEYVKDKDGRRVMMTQKEFDSIVTKQRKKGPWDDYYVVISPDFIRGEYTDFLFLKKEGIDDFGCDMKYAEEDFENDDIDSFNEDEKPYPLMRLVEKPRTFNHKGNIWHHLEITNPYDYWYRSPDGIKHTIQYILKRKEEYEGLDFDLEKALDCIQSRRYADVEERCGIYVPDPCLKFKRLVRHEDIIRRSGSWILTDIRIYQKALKKALNIAKYDALMKMAKSDEVITGRPMGLPKKEIFLGDFEVFIEKVK